MNKVPRICPVCRRKYYEEPSLSRVDNRTAICSICGLREALASSPLSEQTKANIIESALNELREDN